MLKKKLFLANATAFKRVTLISEHVMQTFGFAILLFICWAAILTSC